MLFFAKLQRDDGGDLPTLRFVRQDRLGLVGGFAFKAAGSVVKGCFNAGLRVGRIVVASVATQNSHTFDVVSLADTPAETQPRDLRCEPACC